MIAKTDRCNLLAQPTSKLQILDWLHENFLCFQFGRLIKDHSPVSLWMDGSQPTTTTTASYPTGGEQPDSQTSRVAEQRAELASEDHFELKFLDLGQLQQAAQERIGGGEKEISERDCITSDNLQEGRGVAERPRCKLTSRKGSVGGAMLRVVYSDRQLELECQNSNLMVDLVRLLVIDRLHLRLTVQRFSLGEFVASIGPVLSRLDAISKNSRQLEESEKRIQSELYEAADYSKSLMQQLASANQLNEL